ncbi:MAG: histidinol-phosphate transaminase [Bdellovibrionota bacterium]
MSSSLNVIVPEYIRSLVPYVPGKPIEETQRELKLKRVIKLASNENPLGPSPKAIAAIRKMLPDAHRYPDASAFRLKVALSDHLKTPTSQLIVGNGSNELIDFLIRTYCVPGDSIVTSHGAFIAYKICAQIHGAETLEAPLTADLRFNLPAMAELVRKSDRTRLVFIANPNNPTGTYVTTDELRAFLKDVSKVRGGSVLVVLDYAYWEYVTAKDLPDATQLLKEFENVVVLRTFSKIYGLAGLRAGYGLAAAEIVANLEKVRQPFNMNSPGLAGAEAALGDSAFVRRSRELNERGKKFWENQLEKMGIPYWKSQGNFLLADVNRGLGKSGGEVYQACLRRGVIFRPVANYGLLYALRITIGTMDENKVAAKILGEQAPAKGRSREPVRRK